MIEIRLKGKSAEIIARDDSDAITHRDTIRIGSDAARRRAAKAVGVEPETLLRWLDAVEQMSPDSGGMRCSTFNANAESDAESEPYQIGYGAMRSRERRFVSGACVADALAVVPPSAEVIEWDDTRLVVLDVDFHDFAPPERLYLRTVLGSILPRPAQFMFSRQGGVKCFYTDSGIFTASELAAVAAAQWRRIASGCEIARRTRFGQIERMPPSADVSALRAWYRDVANDGDAVTELLAGRGWSIGQTLPHTDCPLDPGHVSASPRPVMVGERGLYCHSCAGRGIGNPRVPGFVPYAVMVGGSPESIIRAMVAGRCHWEHAQHVFRDRLQLPDSICRYFYAAALKMEHDDSPINGMVFTRGGGMIRTRDSWVDPYTLEPYQGICAKLRELPYTLRTSEDGKLYSDQARVEELQQNHDLTRIGYPPLTATRGIDLYHHHQRPEGNRVSVPFFPSWYREKTTCYPRIVSPQQCTPDAVESAWQTVETVFPGIDRSYVKLLIAAKAFAESGTHQPIFILATGPSASGKSTTPQIAASICGDNCAEVRYNEDHSRLFQALRSAADASTFVVVNEVMKSVGRRGDVRNALNFVLTLSPTTQDYVIHRGALQFGHRPVIVLTDTDIADAIREDVQLGRRIFAVTLSGEVPWTTTMPRAGLSDPSKLRAMSPEMARACDMILSDVVHSFFADSEPKTLADVAAVFGVGTLRADTNSNGSASFSLRRLFTAVCDAPAPSAESYVMQRWPGRTGLKSFTFSESSPLAEAWADCVRDPTEWESPRLVTGASWQVVLGANEKIRLEKFVHQKRIALRFVSESGKINAEIETQP